MLADLIAMLAASDGGPTVAEVRAAVGPLVGVALRLACIVQTEDPALAVELVDGLDTTHARALPYMLAALVDIDKTPVELLAWSGYNPLPGLRTATAVAPATVLLGDRTRSSRTAECGTHNGWLGHQARREEPCDECVIAAAAFDRANPKDTAHAA